MKCTREELEGAVGVLLHEKNGYEVAISSWESKKRDAEKSVHDFDLNLIDYRKRLGAVSTKLAALYEQLYCITCAGG